MSFFSNIFKPRKDLKKEHQDIQDKFDADYAEDLKRKEDVRFEELNKQIKEDISVKSPLERAIEAKDKAEEEDRKASEIKANKYREYIKNITEKQDLEDKTPIENRRQKTFNASEYGKAVQEAAEKALDKKK